MGIKDKFLALSPQPLALVLARLSRVLMVCAGVLLAALMLMSGAGVVARLCGRTFAGSYELAGFAGALLAAFTLAETQRGRGHVELDVITRRYSPRARRAAGAANVLLGALAMAVVALQLVRRALSLSRAGEVSETLKMPFAWVMVAVAAGFVLLAVVYVADALAV
ncbi:MAG: TRAP transporter small permease, partial [Kiritimatiellaeota bacterium]|nr:TRAP transporter small permease [Kiritimatiellota bacterium]